MKSFNKNVVIAQILLAFLVFSTNAFAHAANQSYVFLRIQEKALNGVFEITTDDLNRLLDLDLKSGLSNSDVTPHLPKIQAYVLERASFSPTGGASAYEIRFTGSSILPAGEMGDFVQLNFDLANVKEIPEKIDVKYNIGFEKLSNHQGLLVVAYNWKAGILGNEAIPALVFTKGDTKQQLPTEKSASMLVGFIAMIKLGIWHIWIGIDHILFLLALLLPSVLRSRKEDSSMDESKLAGFWQPVEKFRPALINVIKIVTFFTIAHTITLSLASLEIVALPSRLVESVIAISIALAAIHNIRPVVYGREWIIAFFFGLFHGFGFASVLAEKGFGGDFLAWTLLGFNVGVEIGQLVIIILIFPLLFLLRKTKLYPVIIFFGSIFLILVSIYWFIERAFDVDIPLGGYILRALGLL